jgi:hypothetical protein
LITRKSVDTVQVKRIKVHTLNLEVLTCDPINMIHGMELDNFIHLDISDRRKGQAQIFALPEIA